MFLPATLRRLRFYLVALLIVLLASSSQAQMTPEEQAVMLLASAKRAYNEKNYPFAAARFREFLQRFGSHREESTARFGLALCLIEGPVREPDKALEQFNVLLGRKTIPEYPFVLYYSGLTRRSLGIKALDTVRAKPNEANHWQNVASQQFNEAAKNFGDAGKVFAEKGKNRKIDKALPVELEWAVRSRCDQAEMLLRQRKAKEAREVTSELVSDKNSQLSRYADLATYYHGFASFQLNELPAAGKALSRKTVLENEVFGTHARYLLARVFHLNTKQNEREEARLQYQSVLKDYEANKKKAQDKLRQPDQLKNDLERKLQLERLVRGPVPDHVTRAMFFLGVLQYEDGKFAEALEHFKGFATNNANSPLAAEANLRMGFCLVSLQKPDDAIRILTPLAQKEPTLSDQALYWMGRAHLTKADPKKPETYKTALDTLRRAADTAQQRATANPPDLRAKERKGEILAFLAETQIQANQPREAINTYTTIINEKLLPTREDEMLLEQATAAQLAGDYAESDRICVRFLGKFTESTLLPAVLFRQAENAAFQALAAEKLPNQNDRQRETTKFNDEAIKRYTNVIQKYPEYTHIALARQALGQTYYRKGDLEKAQKTLEAIPPADRNGELAGVSYNLADIYLRQAPARADDAVAAGRLEEKLKGAAEQLENFLSAAPTSPQVPDALLKLGYAQQRMAKLIAQPVEQQKMLASARSTYERIMQKNANDPAAPQAIFERAKVMALQRDHNGAMNELRRFINDPLKKAPVAPMALLQLATLLRGQNRAAEAVKILDDCRKAHETTLQNDKERQSWVLLLQYHHAVALREANKLDEAKQLFENIARAAPDRTEAWDAALRAGQCQKESAEKKIDEAKKQLVNTGLKLDQRQKVEGQRDAAVQDLRNAVNSLNSAEQALAKRKVEDEELQRTLATIRARMMYESAWSLRTLAELEIESARHRLQMDRRQKRLEEIARLTPAGQTPPAVGFPDVPLKDVPVQPSETALRNRYRELIKSFPELTLNADARFELSEILAQRNEHAEAIKLLQGALEGEKEPSAELMDKIKLRLASCRMDHGSRRLVEASTTLAKPKLTAQEKAAAEKLQGEGKKDIEAALEQLQTVTANPKSAMLPHATYREAECQLLLGKTDDAIKLLVKFRDGPYQGMPGLSDRALLRLGNALAEKKQWEPSRVAYQTLIDRFNSSPWVPEARYGVGWAYQNLAQYDNAVNAYNQVTAAVATELAARAQINIGVSRHLQKRYADASTALLVVPFTYDYPDLSAVAMMEAARSLVDNKQSDQAVKLLKRVVRDHPDTTHAEAAKKRLTELGDS